MIFGITTASLVHAQGITNFTTGYFNSGDGYGPAGSSSLDGAPTNAPSSQQWQTTDPYDPVSDTGSTSLMVFTPGWSLGESGDGNQSVYFGNYDPAYESGVTGEFGILPGITNPSLYREFTPLSGALIDTVTWSTDFGIVNLNDPAFPNDDVFGFNLLTAGGASSLAQFSFNPATASLTNGLRFEWYRDGALQAPAFDIEYGALYRLTATMSGGFFDLSIGGLNAQTNNLGVVTNYAVVTNISLVTGGAFSGAFTVGDFAVAAVDWELESGDNLDPGANYMILNTMSVVTSPVPEPATWLAGALLLGVAANIVRRRRARSTGASH
jgi:hypothetical protein